MLTRQGWLVVVASIGLVVSGRVLGVYELFLVGAGVAVLALACAVVTGSTRLRLEVSRELLPPRLYAGMASRVEVAVRNAGTRRTPVLRLRDPVAGTRGAELLLAPLRPGQAARAAYRLPTDRRGVLTIGPLDILVSDPFGLSAVSTTGAGQTQLTIYPHVDEIVAVPHTHGHDPHAGADHPNALGLQGEDFYSLRPYEVGDDLRRVHWRSTARHDELMVRQDELPWQGRVTICLDLRRSTNTSESLELVVSAAASIVTASWRRRDLVRLVATDGTDSGYAAGHAHVEAIMEHLATVGPTPAGAMTPMLEALRRAGHGGSLVAIVATPPGSELEAIARLRGSFGSVTTVVFDPTSWGRRPSADNSPGRRGHVIPVTGSRPFPEAWNQAMRHRLPGPAVAP